MQIGETWREPLPWDYAKKLADFVRPGLRVLELAPEALAQVEGARRWQDGERLPFEDGAFDLVVDRHVLYSPEEVCRVLKRDGFFVTEQVGGADAWEPGPPDYNLENQAPRLRKAGFRLMWQHQAYPLAGAGLRGHRFFLVAKKVAAPPPGEGY